MNTISVKQARTRRSNTISLGTFHSSLSLLLSLHYGNMWTDCLFKALVLWLLGWFVGSLVLDWLVCRALWPTLVQWNAETPGADQNMLHKHGSSGDPACVNVKTQHISVHQSILTFSFSESTSDLIKYQTLIIGLPSPNHLCWEQHSLSIFMFSSCITNAFMFHLNRISLHVYFQCN